MHTDRIVRWMIVLFTCVLLWAVLLWLLPSSPSVRANPGAWFVSAGGSGAACSQAQACALQTALQNAADGDSLYLAAGTYTGAGSGAVVNITRSIHLLCGWDGTTAAPVVRDHNRFKSILDGQGQRRGIYANATVTLTIDGCTVQNGLATAEPVPGYGGGVYLRYARITFTNNEVYRCTGSDSASFTGYGGGIAIRSAQEGTLLEGNLVHASVAASQEYGYGGGIYIDAAPGIVLRNNQVLANTASVTNGLGYGGGVWLVDSSGALVEDNQIRDNVAQAGLATRQGSNGGGLLVGSNRVTVTGNTIQGNVASLLRNGSGGGIALEGADDALLHGNWIRGNIGCAGGTSGTGRGGGIEVYASKGVRIESNRIVDNLAGIGYYGGLGGALYLSRSTVFTMTNNIVAGNGGSVEGGGMAFETEAHQPVTGTLLHNTFANNNLSPGAGGYAIDVNDPYVTLSGTNNLFSGHTYAVYGHDASSVTLTRSLFYANTLGDVGGEGVVNTGAITGQDPRLSTFYHLLPGSPAIDQGVNVEVTTDVDGQARPRGAGYDIGADEHSDLTYVFLPMLLKAR